MKRLKIYVFEVTVDIVEHGVVVESGVEIDGPSISLDSFPVDAFMPSLGVGKITAHTTLNGKGYNPMSKNTSVDADVRLSQVTYLNETYRDINLNTSLHAGKATGTLVSHNPGADATINFDARLYNDSVLYNINGDLKDSSEKDVKVTVSKRCA